MERNMNIQNKILIGIGSFVAIMLLVGLIMINEPARMAVFTSQWEGRSIERGAELYYNNCATCHGMDGLGAAGVAPALKNPMLFLENNPAVVANDEIKALEASKKNLEDALQTHQENLVKRDDAAKRLEAAPADQKGAIEEEIKNLDAQIMLFDANTEANITNINTQIEAKQAELTALKALGWDERRNVRLREVKWAGSMQDYFRSTLISGRPTSALYWPGAMPAWAQEAGGPLRPDEIENLVTFLMNYRAKSVTLTPNDIKQGFKVVGDATALAAADKVVIGDGADVTALDLAGGDAAKGQQLYVQYGCAGCHTDPAGSAYSFAPTGGTFTRSQNIRLRQTENANLTVEQYLANSILYPNAYIVPGGSAGLMPQNFADQLSIEELRDLIAYISTYK
jgi:mono/diheme cytochrome c family protein